MASVGGHRADTDSGAPQLDGSVGGNDGRVECCRYFVAVIPQLKSVCVGAACGARAGRVEHYEVGQVLAQGAQYRLHARIIGVDECLCSVGEPVIYELFGCAAQCGADSAALINEVPGKSAFEAR